MIEQGFNRSFAGKNATAYGKGVYFARDASYSSSRTYSVPDGAGIQYIFACSVCVGEYCLGKQDALTPDVRDAASHSLFDTTVDNTANPSLYVTYHDAQAYPEYLITFRQ
jgi:poly [ADP-ribose] polymerase 10/14/15